MELSLKQIIDLIETASEMGARKALVRVKKIDDRISKSEACREYGPAQVETWMNTKAARYNKSGEGRNCKITFSRLQLDTLQTITKKGILI